jgi:type II secretory pathway component GspD/PulD (secretin)
MSPRLPLLALVCGLLALASGGHAQDKKTLRPPEPPPNAAPKTERQMILLRHADSQAVAEVLGRHFKGEGTFIPVPAGAGNALLVTAPPAVLVEVGKVLPQLDRPPATVVVEVIIAEVATNPADGKKGVDEAEFTGPTKDVMAKLDALTQGGKVGTVQRIKVTATDGTPVTAGTQANKPVTTARAMGGPGGFPGGGGPGGGGARSVSYVPVGTTLKVTARAADETVLLELDLKDTRVVTAGPAAGAGPMGGPPIGPPGFADDSSTPEITTATLTTKLGVRPGQAVTAQAVRTDSRGATPVAL